jgi:hypothetical protein
MPAPLEKGRTAKRIHLHLSQRDKERIQYIQEKMQIRKRSTAIRYAIEQLYERLGGKK